MYLSQNIDEVGHSSSDRTFHAESCSDGVSSYALRDIEAGEELTDDYGTFDDVAWYEALCADYMAYSCLRVGREHRGAAAGGSRSAGAAYCN